MSPMSLADAAIGSPPLSVYWTLVGLLAYWLVKHRRSVASTPPGPTPLPILGNVRDTPAETPWKTYAQWSSDYKSALISVRMFGKLFVIVNTEKAARELLTRRAHIYSDRPTVVMQEMQEWDWNTGLMPYGDRWRKRRRVLHQNLNTTVVDSHTIAQETHINRFLIKLSESPKSFIEHIKHLATGISMDIAYAHDVKDVNDPFVKISEDAVRMLSLSSFPGALLVNAMPILRNLPEWFPGTGFHKFARQCRELTRKMRYDPLNMVKKKMAEGTASPSLARTLLEADPESVDEELIADVTGILYAAGSDTLASTTSYLVAALALYPEVQSRAQVEIEQIVGRHRLPTLADKNSLPYVEAICREVVRWHIVLPLGVPRSTMYDDTCDGQFIPKGTTILWNAWAISQDPEVYPEADKFNPERWLDRNGNLIKEEFDAAFGYGRRRCAGISLAKNTIWMTAASLLATMAIRKSRDELGNEVDILLEHGGGLLLHPSPFPCDIRPRDSEAAELIRSAFLTDV